MFAAYVVAVRTAEGLSVRMVLMSIAALHALILLAPPLISTDVFSYQAYARMGDLYGLNPFLHGPHTIALDPLYPFIGAKWVNTPTVYGPIFTTLSYVIAPISIAASALAYKALAAISSLVMVTLVWKAARLRGVDPVPLRHVADAEEIVDSRRMPAAALRGVITEGFAVPAAFRMRREVEQADDLVGIQRGAA